MTRRAATGSDGAAEDPGRSSDRRSAPSRPPERTAPSGALSWSRAFPTGTSTDVSRALDIHRRVVYLMLFRLVLISLVLGATTLLSWLSDVDLSAPNSLVLFGIIGTTYLLTIIYAVALGRVSDPHRLADLQLVVDLVISALLVHVTGGAQSAYTFFFPLSIIAAATVRFRAGAVVVALASVIVFSAVSVLGWLDIVPSFAGQRLLPSSLTSVELGRSMALNLAAIAGVAVLAYNLGGQIQQTSASLETQRTRAADLRALSQDIVRCLSSGLITIDNDGRVLTANRVACEILDLDPAGVIGQSLIILVPSLADVLGGLGRRDEIRRLELEVTRAHKVILGVSLSPLRNNRDEVIGRILNIQDLTEIREMEAQMRRAERLAVVGTLAAGVAHEIRNPLAAISGSIELLSADPDPNTGADDNRTLMDIINREVDRLNGLITDLLDYTNPQPRELLSFDLVELVRETMTVFEQDREFADLAMHVEIDAGQEHGAIEIVADPARVRQVLWNLLRNAAAAATSTITVRLRRQDDDALIDVRDDGPGIPADVLPQVFDPFFTTKKRGTGLGLATCHSIITEHGGEIRVISPVGEGCTFTIQLPRHGNIPPGRQAAEDSTTPSMDPPADPVAVVSLSKPR